jgi:hypothetical protein
MEIRQLTEEWEPAYEAFVQEHPFSLLYYSLRYKDFLEKLLGCQAQYLVAVDGARIRGVFPMMRKAGKYGDVYNSLPFYGSHGGILADGKESSRLLSGAYDEFLDREPLVAATVISNPLTGQDDLPLRHHLLDERISQMTEIPLDGDVENKILGTVEPSARRNIKKALGTGIEVAVENDQIDFLMSVHKATMQAMSGRAKPDTFFRLVGDCFEAGRDYDLYVARLKQEAVAALLVFYYNRVVEYFVPATVGEFRSFQPLAVIIYKAMVDASRKGLKLWNWGGTWLTQQGVYRFKKKWSAHERRYFYYTFVKNQEIYHCRPEELLAEYGHFFVLPFYTLRKDTHAKEKESSHFRDGEFC